MLVLHDYFRSGASHRVRIALNLKGLNYSQLAHHLRKAEQRAPEYLELNPQGLVPTLVHQGAVITQSMAIIEYLDEAFPDRQRLLPSDLHGRARVRSLVGIIVADTHPLNNLRVLAYLQKELGLTEDAAFAWCRRWLADSFDALERRLARDPETGEFAHGDTPTVADMCLAPQMLSARRFGFATDGYPVVSRIARNASKLEAFVRAEPQAQPDAE